MVEIEEPKAPPEAAPLTKTPSSELGEAAPTVLNPKMPPPPERLITSSLAKERVTRYQSAAVIRFRLPGWVDAIIHPWKLRIALGSVIFAIWAGVFLSRGFHKVGAIGPGDPIVLAEFTNTTGDTVFDGSLNRAFAAGLSQSPYISLLTP